MASDRLYEACVAAISTMVVGLFALPALGQDADGLTIFVGRCVAVRAHWVGNNIFTDATFQVSRVVKGRRLNVVTVRTLGGEVDEPVGVRAVVSDPVRFQLGEVAVVSAKAAGGDVYRVDWPDQKRSVGVDEVTGEEFVSVDGARVALEEYLDGLLAKPSQWPQSEGQ